MPSMVEAAAEFSSAHSRASGDPGGALQTAAVPAFEGGDERTIRSAGEIFYGLSRSHTRMLRPSRPSTKFLFSGVVMVSVLPSSL